MKFTSAVVTGVVAAGLSIAAPLVAERADTQAITDGMLLTCSCCLGFGTDVSSFSLAQM